jgi:hypothetical protein
MHREILSLPQLGSSCVGIFKDLVCIDMHLLYTELKPKIESQ